MLNIVKQLIIKSQDMSPGKDRLIAIDLIGKSLDRLLKVLIRRVLLILPLDDELYKVPPIKLEELYSLRLVQFLFASFSPH